MSTVDPELLSCFIDEAGDLLSKWEGICLDLERSPNEENWNALFRVAHNIKGTSRSVGLDSIGTFVHQVEDGITLAKQGKIPFTTTLFRGLLAAQKVLHDWITAAKADPSHPFDPSCMGEHMRAFSEEHSESPLESRSETQSTSSTDRTDGDEASSTPPQAPIKKDLVKNSTTTQKISPNTPGIDETLRVSAKKLDDLIQMVGELSIQQNVTTHKMKALIGQSSDSQTLYQLKKITRDLYEKALSLRMQPVQPIFQRLDRAIKDIAIAVEKQVDVELFGGDVELDKTVCEKMIEPLTHMVRNSVDHGLEKSEVRAAAGKSPKGVVRLKAIQETSSVVLIIEDDGRGLDVEKIRAKAKERGLINDSTVLSPTEVFALIFLPGFSTAEKVTDVSGRGVGMDVVMRSIDSLKGQILIASEPGKGTRFTIKLPTSLNLIDALMVKLGSIDYAVPLDSIEEVIDFEYQSNTEAHMVRLRDRVIPTVSLSQFLKSSSKNQPMTTLNSPLRKAIIVRNGKDLVAFSIDGVGDQQQIVVRQLNENLAGVQGISGGTILSSGEPGLIVDIENLAKIYLKTSQPKLEVA